MQQRLYRDLTPWYRLLDPPEDHAEEASSYRAAFERAALTPPRTLLDLGSGGGHNAYHLKRCFRCTLTDLSGDMLALSRELNPECEHIPGDLRTLRLGRTFDAVLVHDAVMYMTTVDDLLAAAGTAFMHTRPGGAAIFAPDGLAETLREQTNFLETDSGGRALRGVEWKWDPDPNDTTFVVDYALLLRDGTSVKAVHDRHIEGLFPKTLWLRVLEQAGYRVESMQRPVGEGITDEIFLCKKP